VTFILMGKPKRTEKEAGESPDRPTVFVTAGCARLSKNKDRKLGRWTLLTNVCEVVMVSCHMLIRPPWFTF